MLVLQRRPGETIVIVIDGAPITVEVLDVHGHRGQRVRLAITAPASVPILRGELADRAADESRQHEH